MKELTFTSTIQAPIEKVWNVLWNDDTYRKWTSYFSSSSYMETDWKIGGTTRFLDGEGNGMLTTIKELNPPYKIVFSHIGQILNGKEDTTSDEVKAFAGALEKYTLSDNKGETRLIITVEVFEKYADMMIYGFTKGMEEVKKHAEQS